MSKQLNDRIHWVLGFNNREKLSLCENQAQRLADKLSQIASQIDTFSENDKQRKQRELYCQTLVNIQWQEIDVAPLLDRLATMEPFLGGACFVDITDRKNSGIFMIEYDEDQQRLLSQ